MVVVIAHYRTTPAAVDTVKDLLARHSRSSEAEPGCQQFLAHQDAEDPTRFALYEVYDDMDAFSAHRATAHFAANIEQTLVPLLVEREWRTYSAGL